MISAARVGEQSDCGVKPRITQPAFGDAFQGRRWNDTAERARRAEPAIVGHDQEHVGRAPWRHDARRPPRLRVGRLQVDRAAESWVWRRKLTAGNRRGGAGTAQLGGDRHKVNRCRGLRLRSSPLPFNRRGLCHRSIFAAVSGTLRTACGTRQGSQRKQQTLDCCPTPGPSHRFLHPPVSERRDYSVNANSFPWPRSTTSISLIRRVGKRTQRMQHFTRLVIRKCVKATHAGTIPLALQRAPVRHAAYICPGAHNLRRCGAPPRVSVVRLARVGPTHEWHVVLQQVHSQ